MCEIYSKLKINAPEQRHCRHSDVLIVDSELISHIFLVSAGFEQVNISRFYVVFD